MTIPAFLKRLARSERLLIFLTGIAASVLLLMLYVIQPRFIKMMDLKLYDQLLLQTHTQNTTGVPVIVDIDEKSIAQFGQFPWPRYRVAMLLAKLAQAGALSVGMDIVFAEEDRTSPAILKRQLRRELQVDIDFTGLPEQLMDNDEVMAGVLKTGPFVLGYYFDFTGQAATRGGDCRVTPLNHSELRSSGAIGLQTALMHARGAVCPIPALAKDAKGMGFFNTISDRDGTLRRVPMLIAWKGKVYPSLSLATFMNAFNIQSALIKMSPTGTKSIRLGPVVVPLDGQGQMLVHYRGPKNTFEYISAADVLNDEVPPGTVENRIVLIGTSAAGLRDLRTTPVDTDYPGVETHANVLDTILAKDFIRRPDLAPGIEAVAIMAAGIIITLLLTWAKATWIIVPLVLMGFGLWEGAAWLMDDKHIYISPLYPMLTLAMVFTLLTMVKFWHEERNKKFYHATFSSYLSPDLIEEMVENKTMPELGGQARVITAYFTDIQSFSTFSEKLTAEQLVELLNEYLTVMTDILLDDRGTLDKYEGDAIIAFFGAPLVVPDHGLQACRAAVSMQDALADLRKKWSVEKADPGAPGRNTKNLPSEEWAPGDKWPKVVHEMLMRIGINSGEMVVGNMGSSMRMNYTMMGDAVNLAARLEAGAKQYGIYNAVSEFTMDLQFEDENGETKRVGDLVEARFVDAIVVMGKSEPVKLYELCAMKDGLTDQERRLFELFDKGMAHYLSMEWDEAAQCFEAALPLERVPEGKTTPSEVFLKRCRRFKESPPVPPGETWDGVFRMTSK